MTASEPGDDVGPTAWDETRSRQSSSYYAARYLRRLILEGVLRPGQRIPQDDVAQALGVSRIPVREAIIALEAEGFVTTERHRGAFVSAVDERTVRDQYELHGIIHGFAAQRALERSDGAFVDGLRSIAAALAATDDPAGVGDLAFAFHRTIVVAARSPRIKLVFRSMPGLQPSEFFTVIPDAVAVEKRGIVEVLAALERGDGEATAEAYQAMMCEVGDKVVGLLRQRGLFETAAPT